MSEPDEQDLKKLVSTKKRIAMDWASQVHDLVEDRLLSAYGELPDLAEKTVAACQEWAEAKAKLDAAG